MIGIYSYNESMKLVFFFIVSVTLFFLTPTFISAQTLTGDANGDGKVDGSDFIIWINHYGTQIGGIQNGDFNGDNKVNGIDYIDWLSNYGKALATITPTNPPISQQKGIWISADEIAKLPTTGSAWDRVLSAANSNWGSACLNDLNCLHDTNTLAGALVAVRLNDSAMRNKTIAGIQSAMVSPLYRTLELARNIQCYIIAADIIGYHDPSFENWLRAVLDKPLPGRAGIPTVWQGALQDATNWGNHQRAASIAAYIYLGDTNRVSQAANAYKEYIGLSVSSRTLTYDATNWIADQNNKAGINRLGATIQGVHISGVLPEDWRRGAEFQWPPTASGYMLEGMQGFVVSSVILQRAGIVSFSASDNAVVRAMNMLYGQGEAAQNSPVFTYIPTGDDTWIPWVVNYYGNTSYPTTSASPGKNMGWTDWMYGK